MYKRQVSGYADAERPNYGTGVNNLIGHELPHITGFGRAARQSRLDGHISVLTEERMMNHGKRALGNTLGFSTTCTDKLRC